MDLTRTPAASHLADEHPLAAFPPVPVTARRDGWTAQRQRGFIGVLAETGCVAEAAGAVGMTPRSAYRLAARPDAAAFAEAWNHAVALAARRLTALAFDYAVNGITETVIDKHGEIVAERRRPSERMLIFLLNHLDPHRMGRYAVMDTIRPQDPQPGKTRRLATLLDAFQDNDEGAAPVAAGPPD